MPDASSNMFRGGGYGGGQSSINANPSSSGGDQGGFLSWLQGLAPEAQAAIMRVMQNANPVSSANAATADSVNRAPNPFTTPSPVDPRLAGGGPPIPDSLVGHGDGPPPPVVAPPVVGGGGSSGGAGASGPVVMGPEGSAAPPVMGPPQWFHGSNTPYAPNPVAGAPTPPVRATAPIARVRAHIDPRATALAPGAAALLGYYSAPTGNARGAVYSPYTDPKDPRIFRGPLAAS